MQNRKIITDLGKVRELLKKAESQPEYGKCADIIHQANVQLELTMQEIAKKDKPKVDLKKMSQFLRLLANLYNLLKSLGLEEYFKICKNYYLGIKYGVIERSRKTNEIYSGLCWH